MAERHDDGYRNAVAFVTHTRDYRSAEVLPALARHGYTTTERPHDRETERLLAQFDPDLVVLAVDPRHEGDLALIRSVARTCQGALLVLAPGPHGNGLSAALEAGADVCLRDTDGVEMLGAQLSALSRRKSRGVEPEEESLSVITVRDLVLDFDRCQAVRDQDLIPLTPTEFKILAYLAKNAGKVVSPVEILRAVQDYTYSDREAQEIVKVYIRRIRRKVELDPAEPNYIINVRGFGYMLERRLMKRPESGRVTEAA
ncbi:MAG: response regulator transcription factor [Dehalococcoidia bacterium]|nr:response regulator transcription factor [Dehalococcoidia bacterium]